MVHRWAAAQVTGADPDGCRTKPSYATRATTWSATTRRESTNCSAALRAAPDDLKAMTFLNEAPPPRLFWARRQTHETTIHGRRRPRRRARPRASAVEVEIAAEIALDGLDELLCGFFTRGRSKLFEGIEFDVLVAPDDSERRWLLHIAEKMTVARVGAEAPDVTLTGTAKALYLGLWNRGDEITMHGDQHLLTRWHATQRVRWS